MSNHIANKTTVNYLIPVVKCISPRFLGNECLLSIDGYQKLNVWLHTLLIWFQKLNTRFLMLNVATGFAKTAHLNQTETNMIAITSLPIPDLEARAWYLGHMWNSPLLPGNSDRNQKLANRRMASGNWPHSEKKKKF